MLQAIAWKEDDGTPELDPTDEYQIVHEAIRLYLPSATPERILELLAARKLVLMNLVDDGFWTEPAVEECWEDDDLKEVQKVGPHIDKTKKYMDKLSEAVKKYHKRIRPPDSKIGQDSIQRFCIHMEDEAWQYHQG